MLAPTVLLRRVTVLVVDDEEPLRQYITRVMEDEGYHVITAGDEVEALTLLDQSGALVQLVITDVAMPNMTGPELATRLATQPDAPPVLFMSGSSAGTDLPGPLLTKPFRPDDLNGMVRRLLAPQLHTADTA
ncbi:MAG TPA: response regulator [Gemmatimonadales bacterium]|nr:response regulator [Gemmatimonadales bacterium]